MIPDLFPNIVIYSTFWTVYFYAVQFILLARLTRDKRQKKRHAELAILENEICSLIKSSRNEYGRLNRKECKNLAKRIIELWNKEYAQPEGQRVNSDPGVGSNL